MLFTQNTYQPCLSLSNNARALVSEAFFRSKICTGSTVFLLGNVLQLQDLKPQCDRLYACSPAPKLEQITMIPVLAVPVNRNTALCVACPCIPGRLRAKPLVTCCAVTVDVNTGRRKRLKANGLNFVIDDQGPTGATPVVLLHGFPNRANLWEKQVRLNILAHGLSHRRRKPPSLLTTIRRSALSILQLLSGSMTDESILQIPALLEDGFRVIAPDLRGALNGESDAPQGVQAYDIPKVLVKDVAGTRQHNRLSSFECSVGYFRSPG